MHENNDIKLIVGTINDAIKNNTLLKIVLSKPQKGQGELKNIHLKPIASKGKYLISANFTYPTQDVVKNYEVADALDFLQDQIGQQWLQTNVFTSAVSAQLLTSRKGKHTLLLQQTKTAAVPDLKHDRTKVRSLEAIGQTYLHQLGITNQNGEVLKDGQKKFKQINRYIELLADSFDDKTLPKDVQIVDFGSGKGYLTFGLYDYLQAHTNFQATLTGVELRENLVTFCNQLAKESSFEQLHFVASDIADFQPERIDVMIALHACDTATDLAIAKGISANAQLIVVAPCCHKQIRKEMQLQAPMNAILKFGILHERQCELLTDGLRALILESKGYKVKVVEFIGVEHTPKNVMIIAEKSKVKSDALQKIAAIKAQFGIAQHYLETLL